MKNMPFILIVLALTMIFFVNANRAYAQGVSLATYPSTIQLQAQQGSTARAGFTIENTSSEPIKLKITLKPFRAAPSEDGKLIYIEGNNPTIFRNVKLFANDLAINTLELGPKQSKQLRLELAIEANEPTADHYFSIIFLPVEHLLREEQGEEASAQSIVQAGIALNVLLHAGPKETPNGFLEEFSTESFRTTGPVPFTVRIKNNGKHSFTPKGVILIKNIFNQTVGRIDLQNANILVGTSRSLIGTPYQQSDKKKPVFSPTSPVWPEQFLLGLYTAEVSIALSDEGPVLTHTTFFFAMPLHGIVGSGLALTLIVVIILRIRKKIKDL